MDPAGDAPFEDGQRFKQCDRIEYEVAAKYAGPYDLNRIQIGTNYCVRVLHTRLAGNEALRRPCHRAVRARHTGLPPATGRKREIVHGKRVSRRVTTVITSCCRGRE